MVPKVPPLPYRKVHRALTQHGFALVRQKGSHAVYQHADGRTAVVPRHPGDIDASLVATIFRQAGIGLGSVRR